MGSIFWWSVVRTDNLVASLNNLRAIGVRHVPGTIFNCTVPDFLFFSAFLLNSQLNCISLLFN
jgi:hypothetical protein